VNGHWIECHAPRLKGWDTLRRTGSPLKPGFGLSGDVPRWQWAASHAKRAK